MNLENINSYLEVYKSQNEIFEEVNLNTKMQPKCHNKKSKSMKIKNVYYLFFPVLIFIIIFLAQKNSKRNINGIFKNSKYTCGTIISDWHQRNNQGIGSDYEYIIDNVKYIGIYSHEIEKTNRYLIVYDSLNPKNSKLLFNHSIPKNKVIPLNGWKYNEVPISIDSIELKQYFKEFGLY